MELLAPTIACGVVLTGLVVTAKARSGGGRNFGWGIAIGSGAWVAAGIIQTAGSSLAILGGGMRPMLTALPSVAALTGLAISATVALVVVGLARISWKQAGAPTLHVVTGVGALIGSCVPWVATTVHFRHSTVPVTVIVRDSSERPVHAAKITWTILKNTGWRSDRGDIWEERLAGPIASSNAAGRSIVSLHPSGYRTDVRVEKEGFTPATLRLDRMERAIPSVTVSFPGYANGRSGNLASSGPFVIYLPTEDEFASKQIVQVRQAAWRVGVGPANARTVRLWTTRTGAPVEVRVWPEFVPYSESGLTGVVRTCVEPLHGTRLALRPAYPQSFDETATSSEWLSFAPAQGETDTIKFHAGSSPSDTIYVLAPKNEEYGHLFVQYCRSEIVDGKSGSDYIVEASIAHNPTGSRALFPPITEYKKPPIE